jgi:hypothetical protein
MVVWWSSGECDSPEIDGIDKEAGNYVENAWFGGVTLAEFLEDKVGVFENMLSVGVETGGQYYPVGMSKYFCIVNCFLGHTDCLSIWQTSS